MDTLEGSDNCSSPASSYEQRIAEAPKERRRHGGEAAAECFPARRCGGLGSSDVSVSIEAMSCTDSGVPGLRVFVCVLAFIIEVQRLQQCRV